MSASSKFDLSSGGPDRPLYASSYRGSYGAASMERSGSFRENMENPLLSSLPNMTRSNSSATPGDVLNFLHCVRVDPKSMVVEHKLNRPAEFKSLASAAVGVPVEDSISTSSKSKHLAPPSLDDLRRLKSGVLKSGTKARERVKTFNDCLSVINKCFPTIPSRKRSRLDALSIERSNALSSVDRSESGVGIGKMGLQNHAGFELEQQKSEVRIKNTTPRKRTRTSMADARTDVRSNNPTRLPGAVDKERDAIRIFSSNSVQSEERASPMAVDGWENSKMKKKRTVIKQDNAASSMTAKAIDAYREPKQGTHPRLLPEARSRLADAYGFRSSAANGGTGVGKGEATSQTSSGMRSSMSRTDSDNSSVLHEKRDRPNGQEKERMNLKAVNKANSREDISSSSLTSGSKLNANVRAPRSGLVGGVSKLSQPSNDWDLSNCTNKTTVGLVANSRKRTPSARSSSPWIQKPQKFSRTARRTNLLPIASGNDEGPVTGVASDKMVNERRFPANSPEQTKMKGDINSPAALSESEGSGAVEIKSRDKFKKCDELGGKSTQNLQKLSTLLLPPRKNKPVNGDNHKSGVRKQGRTGRGFTSSRSLLPLTLEKHGNVGTTKQIRSSRLVVDKAESRAGRPPTRKLSDRKAYARQKHITINKGADFLFGSDDGHEELLAAANAAINTTSALSSPLWKKMEPLFHFITDVDISYLKEQVNYSLAAEIPAPVSLDTASCTLLPDCGSNEIEGEEIEARKKKPNEISLYQRLIAALIPEEEEEEELKYDVHDSSFEIEKHMGLNTFTSDMSPSCEPTFDGYDGKLNGRLFYEMEHNIMSIPDTGFDHLQNGSNDQSIPSTICSENQYEKMSMNERLIMEVHSIGIYPDLVSGDEELSGDITKLDEKYQEQILRKKSLLGKLLCSASDAKKRQQKEFEESALDKLVEMAYAKYMSCWGPTAHGMKNATGRLAKQAAMAFVNRTMEQYQKFEETGKSCFDNPLHTEIFLSGISRLNDGLTPNSSTDNESGKLRTSAVVGTQQSPSSNSQDVYSSEVFEQVNGKEESWSNRAKRRELSLDNVGGNITTGFGSYLSCSVKGKRTERDREGKGNNREVKGERKSKAKPKQKATHLSASLNDSQAKGRVSTALKSNGISRSKSVNDKNDPEIEMLEEPIDLSGLQLPDMDDLGGNGEDLGSWLMNIDDDGVHENDCLGGLGIPMDDLTELNMMV